MIVKNILTIKLALVIAFFQIQCQSQEKKQQEQRLSSYTALKRSDNDFVTNIADSLGDKIALPEELNSFLDQLEGTDSISNSKKQNLIFWIDYDPNTVLLVVKKIGSNYEISYHVMAFDKTNKLNGKSLAIINGKWMDNNEEGFDMKFLEKPLIFFQDINNDNKNEIVIKERAHNGNIYNAEIWNYFELDKTLNLKKILAVEVKQLSIFDECLITRSYDSGTITANLNCEDGMRNIGQVSLEIGDSVRIKNKIINIPPYGGMVITGSGMNEVEFLNKGFNFKY